MKNQVNPQVKKERVTKLIELGNKLKEEYESKFVGREVDVIVETYNPKTNLFKGYSSNYLEVHLSSENDVRGKYLKVIYNR